MKEKIVVTGIDKPRPYSHLLGLLDDAGLVANMSNIAKPYFCDDKVLTSYGNEYAIVHFKKDYKINGLLLTEIGSKIGSLYSPRETDLGKTIYRDWLLSFDEDTALIRDISEQEKKEKKLV